MFVESVSLMNIYFISMFNCKPKFFTEISARSFSIGHRYTVFTSNRSQTQINGIDIFRSELEATDYHLLLKQLNPHLNTNVAYTGVIRVIGKDDHA